MLTKNAIKFVMATNAVSSVKLTSFTGSNISFTTSEKIFSHIKDWAVASSQQGVYFSTSTTPPTNADYKPSDVIEDDAISVTVPDSPSVNITDTYTEISSTFGVAASKLITISSVFLGHFSSASVLIDHTLLQTPITLQPGESKQLTYTIRFNYPKAGA